MLTSEKYLQFNDMIINDYSKIRSNFFEAQRFVGEVVWVAQQLEMELKKLICSNESTEHISIERISPKTMIRALIKEGFFKEDEYADPATLEKDLTDVVECRNWVVHNYYLERGYLEDEELLTESKDELFLGIVRRSRMFSKEHFELLCEKIESKGWNKIYIEFNKADLSNKAIWVSCAREWSDLKLAMTKMLLHEFQDALQKSERSIFASNDYWENAFKNYLHNLTNRNELRAWLEKNHDKESCAWIPMLKDEFPQGVPEHDIIEEALCFGWRSVRKKDVGLTDDLQIIPRKKKHKWSEIDKQRARRLIKLGLMTKAGQKVLPKDIESSRVEISEEIIKEIKKCPVTFSNFKKHQKDYPLYIRVKIDEIQSFDTSSKSYKKLLESFLDNTKNDILICRWNDDGRLLENLDNQKEQQ